MKDLKLIREEIDEIDRQMVALYEERMRRTTEVARYKLSVGMPVLDKVREQEKLKAVKACAEEKENGYDIGELFGQIMTMSRKRQYHLMNAQGQGQSQGFSQVGSLPFSTHKVVYQGVEGAYSQQAMKAYFGEGVDSFHVDTWRDAMEAIQSHKADYAVLPIENSSAGIVGENFDLLVEYGAYIVAEQTIKAEHALLVLPGAGLGDIRRVYSHPQALMQSVDFLDAHPEWERISVKNTAGAAKKILEDGKKYQAAIASPVTADIYGLEILRRNINYSDENSTRFIIVSGEKICLDTADRISICFEASHESGALYHVLSHLIFNHMNMVKIESRPIKDKSFEYRFFVDLEGNLKDGAVQNALRGVEDEALYLKVLGNY